MLSGRSVRTLTSIEIESEHRQPCQPWPDRPAEAGRSAPAWFSISDSSESLAGAWNAGSRAGHPGLPTASGPSERRRCAARPHRRKSRHRWSRTCQTSCIAKRRRSSTCRGLVAGFDFLRNVLRLGDLPAEAVGCAGDAGGLLEVGLGEVVGRRGGSLRGRRRRRK